MCVLHRRTCNPHPSYVGCLIAYYRPFPPLLPSKTPPFSPPPSEERRKSPKGLLGWKGGRGGVLFPSLSYALANNPFPSPRKDGTVRTREGRKKEGRLQIVGGVHSGIVLYSYLQGGKGEGGGKGDFGKQIGGFPYSCLSARLKENFLRRILHFYCYLKLALPKHRNRTKKLSRVYCSGNTSYFSPSDF